MAAYVLRRLWQMIPTLAGVILLIFFLFKFFGGDPAEILAGQISDQQQIRNIRQQLGLDLLRYPGVSSHPADYRLSTSLVQHLCTLAPGQE